MGNCQHGKGTRSISSRSESKGRYNQLNSTVSPEKEPSPATTSHVKVNKQMPETQSKKGIHSIAEHKAHDRTSNTTYSRNLNTSAKTSTMQLDVRTDLQTVGNNRGNDTPRAHSRSTPNETKDYNRTNIFQTVGKNRGDDTSRSVWSRTPNETNDYSGTNIFQTVGKNRGDDTTRSDWSRTPNETNDYSGTNIFQTVGKNRGDDTTRSDWSRTPNETNDYSGTNIFQTVGKNRGDDTTRSDWSRTPNETNDYNGTNIFQTVRKNRGDDTTRSDWSRTPNETNDYNGPYPLRIEKAGDEENHIETHKDAGHKSKRTKQIEKLEARVKTLTEEKDKLLDRLSTIGALKLTENNPNITDLSDANRPEKLVEQLSELYDNEWTEAYLHLTKTQGKMIDQSVKLLLQALKLAYDICLSTMDERAKMLRKAILTCVGLSDEESNELELKEIEKKMWAYRQKKTQINLTRIKEEVKNTFRQQLEIDLSNTLTLYIDGCVHICWFMCIKNPPMHLDFGETEVRTTANKDKSVTNHFDKSKFVAYTKNGNHIDYVVWPAVYLHERGPIMKKGVAQGSKHPTNTLTDVA